MKKIEIGEEKKLLSQLSTTASASGNGMRTTDDLDVLFVDQMVQNDKIQDFVETVTLLERWLENHRLKICSTYQRVIKKEK